MRLLTWDAGEHMNRGLVLHLLWSDKAQLVNLGFIAHQVNAQYCVVQFQALSDERDVICFEAVEGKV